MADPQSAKQFRLNDPFFADDLVAVMFAASVFNSTWRIIRNKLKTLS